jgi:hypothetical protein
LVVVSDEAAGAPSIRQAAALQLLLERSGRTLQLGVTRWLTDSLSAPNADLLVVARYQEIDKRSSLLADAGFVLQQGPALLPGDTPSPPTATPGAAAPPPLPPTPAAFPAKPLPATTDPPRFSASQAGRVAVGQPSHVRPVGDRASPDRTRSPARICSSSPARTRPYLGAARWHPAARQRNAALSAARREPTVAASSRSSQPAKSPCKPGYSRLLGSGFLELSGTR